MVGRKLSDNSAQIDALDGLRGLAALIVVLSHTSNLNMYFAPLLDFRGIGKSGVYLFFLLSSFLLTLPLIRQGRNILTLKVMSRYWQRRFLRIYPLYICYLLLALTTTWLSSHYFGTSFGQPFDLDFAGFLKHLILQESKGLTWSIAVEFKFYFVLPFLTLTAVAVHTRGIPTTLGFFLALLGISQLVFPQSQTEVNDSRLLPYLPIFIFGTGLAFIQNHINCGNFDHAQTETWGRRLGIIGVLGIIIMTPLVYFLLEKPVDSSYFHKQFILYALFWSFFLFSAINVKGTIQRFFCGAFLRFLGAISFSLYLLHPIFIIIALHAGWNGYFSAWFVLTTSTLIAYLSFKYLEYPLSRVKAVHFSKAKKTKYTHEARKIPHLKSALKFTTHNPKH